MSEAVASYHEPLENEQKKAKSLEGQTYRDVSFGNNFDGDVERGKVTFQQVVGKSKEQQKPRIGYLVDDEMETDEPANSSSPASSSNQNNPQQNFSAQPIN